MLLSLTKCSCLLFSDDGNYVIPNIDSVVTGGTHQLGDWDTVKLNIDKPVSRTDVPNPMSSVLCLSLKQKVFRLTIFVTHLYGKHCYKQAKFEGLFIVTSLHFNIFAF